MRALARLLACWRRCLVVSRRRRVSPVDVRPMVWSGVLRRMS